jgi:hypothetical protein
VNFNVNRTILNEKSHGPRFGKMLRLSFVEAGIGGEETRMSNNTRPSIPMTCPICGHSSYSPDGIHPQCAVTQADAPRQAQLLAAKKAMALEKQQAIEDDTSLAFHQSHPSSQ